MRAALLSVIVALGAVSYAASQTATTEQKQSAPPTLAQIGMYIYPAKGQTSEQQQADEAACTQWAEAQTGLVLQGGSVDTEAAAKAAGQQAAEATQGAAVAGAARGALVGTAIGAIAGNTGEGAAIGAVAGAVMGRRARRHAVQESEAAGAEQAQQQSQQNLDAFKNAAGACLQGRGYTVT